MGLLSHLWHVINREIIAGSLQWLETAQIPGNDASIPTPRPHFSLCLPAPCPSHTPNKVRWRHRRRWPPVTRKLLCSVPDLAFPSGEVLSHRAPPCPVSQRSLALRTFIPGRVSKKTALWSPPGCEERALPPSADAISISGRALLKGQPTSGTLQTPEKGAYPIAIPNAYFSRVYSALILGKATQAAF